MPFKCGVHDFTSADKAEIEKHVNTLPHTTSGRGPCNICGKVTDFSHTGKRSMRVNPIICDDCKNDIRGGSA